MYCIFSHQYHHIILKIAFCNLIIFYHKALSFTIRKKRKKKSRSGLSHPNRPLFLRFFTSTLNLRSVQKHHQQCPILKHLDMVQRFQHKIRIHLFQRLRIFCIFHKFLCPVSGQKVFSLHLLFPLFQENLTIFHQRIPGHKICLHQCFFLHVAVIASLNTFHPVPFAALPHFPVISGIAAPSLSGKDFIAGSADNPALFGVMPGHSYTD